MLRPMLETDTPSTTDRCAHISSMLESIEAIVQAISFDQFKRDQLSQLALERMFEIVGVASSHIPVDLKESDQNVDWQMIDDLDKRLMNPLLRIEAETLWDAASHLEPLKSFVKRRLGN